LENIPEDIKQKWDIFEHIGTVGGEDYLLSCKELGC